MSCDVGTSSVVIWLGQASASMLDRRGTVMQQHRVSDVALTNGAKLKWGFMR